MPRWSATDDGVHGEMKNDALKVLLAAIEGNQEERTLARHQGPLRSGGTTWHCIVGSDFGPLSLTNPSTSSFFMLESLPSASTRTRQGRRSSSCCSHATCWHEIDQSVLDFID